MTTITTITTSEPLTLVRIRMRKHRLVGGTRVPVEPVVCFARIVSRHPKQPIVLVEPEGPAAGRKGRGVWVGIGDIIG